MPDAAYFDYKRRNDPEFRRNLKKEKKLHAKAQKAQANAQNESQRERLREAVRNALAEGFPTDVEEKEAYFMSEVAHGETLCSQGIPPGHPFLPLGDADPVRKAPIVRLKPPCASTGP